MRAVVPEFPASRGSAGEVSPEEERERVVPERETDAPSCSRQARVEAQSAPPQKLWTLTPSVERAPRRAALWEMDLSPGRWIVPCIFFAGVIFFTAFTLPFEWKIKKTGSRLESEIRSLLFFEIFRPGRGLLFW